MLFLFLAIVSSSVLAIALKYLNTENTYGVYFINYCTCAFLAFLFMEHKDFASLFPWLLGALAGLLYLVALIAYGYSIGKSGAVLSSVFSRLGVLVPVLLSVCFYGERPSLLQIVGLVLAVVAMVVVNLKSGGGKQGKLSLLPLLLVLLFNGASDSMSKVFAQGGRREDDGLFVFCIFLFAALFTLVPLFCSGRSKAGGPSGSEKGPGKRLPLGKRDILFGVAVGVPNFFASRFLLAALTDLPAFFVYPTYSVGAIVLISVVSLFLFHEKLTRLQWGGTVLILGALVLLNL